MASPLIVQILLIIVTVAHYTGMTRATYDIGVCYGRLGDNLPSAIDVVSLYKKCGINKMRLFDPSTEVLQALKGSNFEVTLGVKNEDLANLAGSQTEAESWFATNIQPYIDDILFPYIAVGNEAIPGEYGQYIGPAMQNIQNVLDANQLAGISVTTVVATDVLGASYPPSNGSFSNEVAGGMLDILKFLSSHGTPLMINVYPYFAYAADPVNIRLDYAQFTATGPIVQDGDLSYSNLFDAILDAFFWAMEKQGVTNVDVAISESGWPSDGNGNLTTPTLAATYNKNFMNHVMNNGTPKRPNIYIEAYIFALFNENLKPAGIEQNFGLFFPNMEPVYPFF